MNRSGRLSAVFSGIAFTILAVLLLLMNRGPAASDAVVIMWLVLFILATLCAIAGIVFGSIGLRRAGKLLAWMGLGAGIVYLISVSILLANLIEFIRSVTD